MPAAFQPPARDPGRVPGARERISWDRQNAGHHFAQFGNPLLGKEQPWQALAGIKPHQTPLQQALGGRRNFRLASL
jgi:hypothetical protein